MSLPTGRTILMSLVFFSIFLITLHTDLFAGQMDFDAFRMLEAGTTEAEVLSRAGPPDTNEVVSQELEKDGTLVLVRQFSYIPGPEENDPQLTIITFKKGIITDIKRSPVFTPSYGNN